MKFEKYQHVERLGSVEVEGILNGIVHVFPKLDGTNTSVYLNDEDYIIPKLLGVVWYSLITEEMFNILRKFKNPKIDFGLLRKLTIEKVKDIKSEIFAK